MVKLLSLPFIILTLGLLLFVINALMLLLTSELAEALDLGFRVDGFWTAVVGSIVISIVSGSSARSWTTDVAALPPPAGQSAVAVAAQVGRSGAGGTLEVVSSPTDPPRPRVLVVDDDRPCASRCAGRWSSTATTSPLAADGAEALAGIGGIAPDAVVMDVMMPRLDGIEATRALRAAGNDLPILVLTARDSVGDRVDGLDAGADDYLTKPFALEELLARLRALLRRTHPAARSERRPRRASSSPSPTSRSTPPPARYAAAAGRST